MSFRDLLIQAQRLTILQLLREADGYDLNDRILRAALVEFGHRPSRDQLLSELAWLAEQGLIATRVAGGFVVATLTERGEDAATGRARVPGVKRPSPDDAD